MFPKSDTPPVEGKPPNVDVAGAFEEVPNKPPVLVPNVLLPVVEEEPKLNVDEGAAELVFGRPKLKPNDDVFCAGC